MKNFSDRHPEECWEEAYKAGLRGLLYRTPQSLDDEVCERAWHEGWTDGHEDHLRDITPDVMRKHGALAALMADEPMTPPTNYSEALLLEWRRGYDSIANSSISEYLQNPGAKNAYRAGTIAARWGEDSKRTVPVRYASQWCQIKAWLAGYDNTMSGVDGV